MKYSSRFFLYAPMGLFLAIAFGVGIHWWLMASALSARLAAWNGHQIAPGVTMQFASRTISGFPFSLDIVFRDVAFAVATPRGPTTWRSEKFAMHALTYGRDETIFEAAGRQELDWTRDDGKNRNLVFVVGSLHASAIEDRGGLTRFDLDLIGFNSPALRAQRLQFHVRLDRNDTLELAVMADGLRTGLVSCPNLGDGVDGLTMGKTITKAGAFSLLRAGTQSWEAAVRGWRTLGGKIDRSDPRLVSPEAHSANASLRLQEALQRIPADRIFAVSDLSDALCGIDTAHH